MICLSWDLTLLRGGGDGTDSPGLLLGTGFGSVIQASVQVRSFQRSFEYRKNILSQSDAKVLNPGDESMILHSL